MAITTCSQSRGMLLNKEQTIQTTEGLIQWEDMAVELGAAIHSLTRTSITAVEASIWEGVLEDSKEALEASGQVS